jgi:O-antigen ligase
MILLGVLLIFILPFEYFRMKLPYGNWPSPYIFGQPHGVMLSGLLLSVTVTAIIYKLLLNRVKLSGIMGYIGGAYALKLFILLAVILISLVWLQSRGAIVVTTIALLILFNLSPYCGYWRRFSIICIILVSIFIGFINPFKNEQSNEFYAALIQEPKLFVNSDSEILQEFSGPILGSEACLSIKDSISDRWIHYQTAISLFIKYPIFGVGANHYGDYACTKPGSFPHSTILQVLSELGVMGGLLYLTLLFTAFKKIYTRYHSSINLKVRAITAWILSFFVMQLVIGQLYGNYYFSASLYFALGIASSISKDRDELIVSGGN